MEIATTSSALNLFPTRFEIKRDGYKLPDFSDVSLLDPQILSRRIGRDGDKRAMVAPKKRQYSDEQIPPKKRQKTIIKVDSTTKAKSVRTLKAKSLDKSVSESKQETKTKVTKPVDARSITPMVTTKPEKSVTAYETEAKKPDLRSLIAKAQHKIQEKRKIDHRQVDITNQRIAARLAVNQVVATDEFYEHLNYHIELEQLGGRFIKDQVDCLKMFNLLSRSDYYSHESNYSVLKKNKTPCCDEYSTRKNHQRSKTHKSMKHSSEDPQITNNGESAKSYNQRKNSVQSSTRVRIQ